MSEAGPGTRRDNHALGPSEVDDSPALPECGYVVGVLCAGSFRVAFYIVI
jgi:hypothetical protein